MAGAVGLPFAQRGGLGRGDVAGADGVALDVVLAVLTADVAGEHLETALGGGIGAHGLAAQFAHHGADVDDLALAAFHHLRDHGGRADVRAHQVHVNHLLEFGAGHFVHGDALDDAGVVHQDVNLADFLVDAVYQFLHRHFVGHVAHITVHVGDTGGFVGFQALFHGGLVGGVEDDVLHTGFHKSLGNGEANAVCGACHPGILSFERENIRHIVIVLLVISNHPASFLGLKRLQKKPHLAPIQSSGCAVNSCPAAVQVFPSRL